MLVYGSMTQLKMKNVKLKIVVCAAHMILICPAAKSACHSERSEESAFPMGTDCHVATLLAMTRKLEVTAEFKSSAKPTHQF